MKNKLLPIALIVTNFFYSQTTYTSDNANKSDVDWTTKKIVSYDDMTTKGTLTLRSSNPVLGDVMSLYDNRLGVSTMYGFGIEADGTLYHKAVTNHRWYLNSNADLGINSKMELSAASLFVNTKLGIGTSTPNQQLDVDGIVELGNKSTLGGVFLAQEYSGDDYIGTLSSNYSSGALILGYGVAGMKDEGVNGQLVSTFDNFTAHRGALRLGQGTLEFLSTPLKVNTPVGQQLEVESRFFINQSGNVGIGTTDTFDYKLAVNGTIGAKKVKVEIASAWPDYVFTKDYDLPTLKEVEKQITEKGYLAGMPSATEVKEKGVDLGDMNKKLLQKIEELTLYTIQQEKKIEELGKQNSQLIKENKRIDDLEEKVNTILKLKK